MFNPAFEHVSAQQQICPGTVGALVTAAKMLLSEQMPPETGKERHEDIRTRLNQWRRFLLMDWTWQPHFFRQDAVCLSTHSLASRRS